MSKLNRLLVASALALCASPAGADEDSAGSLFVDAKADPGTVADGSHRAPFATISAAIARVTAASPVDGKAGVVIHVAEGVYANEAMPLDLPARVRLVGETKLIRDYRGLPTGFTRATVVLGGAARMFRTQGDDVQLEGLVLRGTGTTVLITADGSADARGGIRRLSIRSNVLERGLVKIRYTSGVIQGNFMRDSGGVSGIIKGGPADHPAVIRFADNRVTGHFFNGIHFDGEKSFPGDAGYPDVGPSALHITVEGNDFSGNGSAGLKINGLPQFGAGAQFFIDDADDTNRAAKQFIDAQIIASVRHNTFEGNQNYGVVMGGRLRSPQSKGRVKFVGDFSGNSFCGNGNNAGMFGFTFFGRSLKYHYNTALYTKAATRFFGDSEYRVMIDDDDGLAGNIDHDNPAADPGDAARVLGNRLEIGEEGRSTVYEGTSISPFKTATMCIAPHSDSEEKPDREWKIDPSDD